MKFSAIAMIAVVTAISVSARATTGMPSQHETAIEQAAGSSTAIDIGTGAELGFYARYLMLNGKTRGEAIAEAVNIDHPASTKESPKAASAHESGNKTASANSVQQSTVRADARAD